MPTSAAVLQPDEMHQIASARGAILSVYLFALVICLSRLYVRRFVLHGFHLDDWACVAGLLSTTGFAALSLAVIEYGAGRHLANIPFDDAKKFYLFYYSMTVTFIFFALPIKTSLLLYIRRVVPFPYVLNLSAGILVFLILFTVSGCILDAFFCNPPRYVYDINWVSRADRAAHCLPNDVSYDILVYQGALAFVTDIAIFLLPIPALYRMTVSRGKWLALATIFSSAALASITPIIRLQNAKFQRDTGVTDLTFYSLPLLYWTNVEYNMGMVAGSIGTLRPLFNRIIVSISSLSGSGNSGETAQSNVGSNEGAVVSPRRGRRGMASRVQGDSVLQSVTVVSISQLWKGRGGRDGGDGGTATVTTQTAIETSGRDEEQIMLSNVAAPGASLGRGAVHLVDISDRKEAASPGIEQKEATISRLTR